MKYIDAEKLKAEIERRNSMKAPDKLYLREFKEGGLSQVWSGIKPTEDTIIASSEYINKDTILEYLEALKSKAMEFRTEGGGDVFYGAQIIILEEIIDKIKSL